MNATQAIQQGLHVLFGVLVTVSVAFITIRREWTGGLAVAVAILAAWYGVGIVLANRFENTPGARRVSWQGVAWLIGLIASWAVCTWLNRIFVWTSINVFLLALLLLPTVLGVVVVAVVDVFIIAVQLAGSPAADPVGMIAGPTLGAAVAVGIAAGYRVIVRESAERARLITELTEARDDLVALQDTLAATQREAGALTERARLARDIHDTLAQGFSSILLLARAGLARTGTDERPLLGQIAEVANENLDEARRVVHALAPTDLEAAGLPDAIGRQLTRLGEQAGLRTELAVDGEPVTLPTGVEVALLRVAQGALSNVRRHAHATRVHVTLTYEPDEVRLDVVDDGRGFQPADAGTRPDGSGFGLRSIQERVRGLGGQVSIESAPGDGSALVATVPLGARREEQP